ncbi:MAG: 8-amino-7-oxononanoate synthase [Verrucomicrobiae bacterium]|nr:8-amino-7-oxononanoate synthase [Verrucomicrobiae bacterium]
MLDFDTELKQRLDSIRQQGLFRELRRMDSPQGPRLQHNGRELINFSSNDYLGLANHPALTEAAIQSVKRFGAGSGASRLICGSLAPHHELEEALAAFKGTEAALTFSSGYAAALGAIPALLGRDDVVILDKLVHASIVDAARLSGAKIRIFAHNDLNELEEILKWSRNNPQPPISGSQRPKNVLVVTESVFSMDGDHAPLAEMVALKDKYGAWLMVDEAHATGLYGQYRRGLAEALGVSESIEIQMGTLGKALGASGGYLCGSRTLIDFLVNRARSFIFSTAPVPAAAAAAQAALQLVQSREGATRCEQLWQQVQVVGDDFRKLKLSPQESLPRLTSSPANATKPGAIIPVIIGQEAAAVTVATELRARGFLIPAIRYPTVARGSARLRITLTAAHNATEIAQLTAALADIFSHQS